ncbi:hypothetical protein BT96DRAFT_924434, partial [Gymnopus androsaceus JB14]
YPCLALTIFSSLAFLLSSSSAIVSGTALWELDQDAAEANPRTITVQRRRRGTIGKGYSQGRKKTKRKNCESY